MTDAKVELVPGSGMVPIIASGMQRGLRPSQIAAELWNEYVAPALGPRALEQSDAVMGEAGELRKERDALLQKPIDLAKMDSIDEDASGKMVAYYWYQQAQEARAALPSSIAPVQDDDAEDGE